MDEVFIFEETMFVTEPGIGQKGEWSEEYMERIENIRYHNPEIQHWGSLAIGLAMGDFSQSILAVSCANWVRDRSEALLTYMYIKQKCPEFDFGLGLYHSNLYDYAEMKPWESNLPLPAWVRY